MGKIFLNVIMIFMTGAISWINEKQIEEEEKEYKYISRGLFFINLLYVIADSFCADRVVFPILQWIQKHRCIVIVYALTVAIIPHIIAKRERNKGTFRAKEDYAINNLKYNVWGIIAAGGLFLLVSHFVGDLNNLYGFYMDDIAPAIASVCVCMTLIYQKTERGKDKAGQLDHDAALKHTNQKVNLLHLFNAYFLGLTSIVSIVAYTIYSKMYHMTVTMNLVYLLIFTLVLCFFYKLSQDPLRYLYLISIILIPTILVSSIYWMSWFSLTPTMRVWQGIYVVFHVTIYMFLIFKKEGVIIIRKNNTDDVGNSDEKLYFRIGRWKIFSKNSGLWIYPIIVIMIYGIVWALPFSIERLPANEAYNYIDMVCADTDIDADDMIERVKNQGIYDEISDSYDVEGFMKFLSEELEEQLLDKGLIEKGGEIPTLGELLDEYKNMPRNR